MLEFAREQWLWLFLLVAAFYVAWWFARRYRKRRVTYGRIWERVAKRVLPPGWKRVLRTVLTLLIGGVMLSAIVLRAAGLQRPASEQPPPKLVVIVLDNSPSMRAVHDGKTRAELAQARAQQIVDTLADKDRAIVAYHKEGNVLLGRWLKRGEVLGQAPPTDFAPVDRGALIASIGALTPPPELPSEPAPEKLAFLLTDHPLGGVTPALAKAFGLDEPLGVPTHVETFGAPATNHAVASVKYEPQDGSGGKLTAVAFEYGDGWRGGPARVTVNGHELTPDGATFTLPASREPQEVRVFTGKTDPLPQDDEVLLLLNPVALHRVAICSPAGEEANPLLQEALAGMLPGREFFECGPAANVETDLLVCDRAIPATFEARFLLCFGVLPPVYGRVEAPVRADAGLRLHTPPPRGLGFEVPDFSLLSARQAWPLADGHSLEPLVRHIEGGALVALKRGETEVMYSGFVPHLSTLLSSDYAGFLLMLRWLTAIQGGGTPVIPPFVESLAETEFELEHPGKLLVHLRHHQLPEDPADLRALKARNEWMPAHGPTQFEVTTGPDGRGKLGPFTVPGAYSVTGEGTVIGNFTAIWSNPIEQSLPFEAHPPTDLQALFHPAHQPDWRDHLPGLLLWIALGLLVLEWLLWLVGVTE